MQLLRKQNSSCHRSVLQGKHFHSRFTLFKVCLKTIIKLIHVHIGIITGFPSCIYSHCSYLCWVKADIQVPSFIKLSCVDYVPLFAQKFLAYLGTDRRIHKWTFLLHIVWPNYPFALPPSKQIIFTDILFFLLFSRIEQLVSEWGKETNLWPMSKRLHLITLAIAKGGCRNIPVSLNRALHVVMVPRGAGFC